MERAFQILIPMNVHEPLEIKYNFQGPSSSDSPLHNTKDTVKEIGDEEPCYSTKISILSFIWAGLAALLYTKHAQYNEGCAKLN